MYQPINLERGKVCYFDGKPFLFIKTGDIISVDAASGEYREGKELV